MRRAGLLVTVVAFALAAAPAFATKTTPIPETGSARAFKGAPATPNPIKGVPSPPQNQFMSPNGLSEIHDDEWQSDFYQWGGPLGRSPRSSSSYLPPGHDCGTITFDRRGRLIAICIGTSGPELYMFNPKTLATLATFSLPPRKPEDAGIAISPGGTEYVGALGGIVALRDR